MFTYRNSCLIELSKKLVKFTPTANPLLEGMAYDYDEKFQHTTGGCTELMFFILKLCCAENFSHCSYLCGVT